MLAIARNHHWAKNAALLALVSITAHSAARSMAAEPPAAAPAAAPAPAAAVPARPAARQFQELDTTKTFVEPPLWKATKSSLYEKGKAANKEEQDIFTGHYRFVIAEMTQKANRGKLSEKRWQLKKDLNAFGRAADPSLHDQLVELLFKSLLPAIFNKDTFSPAARVNCLLIYGDLNSKEGDVGGAGAVPLAAAYPVLLTMWKNAANPLELRVVALVGLARHAEAEISPEARRDLTQEMLALLRTPPKGVSPEVQEYLRLRAIEILRMLATKGPEANSEAVAAALFPIVRDKNVSLDVRCEAVRTLGALGSKSFPARSVSMIGRTFAGLAVEIGHEAIGSHAQAAARPAPPVVPTPTPAPDDAVPDEGAPPVEGAKPADGAAATPAAPAGTPVTEIDPTDKENAAAPQPVQEVVMPNFGADPLAADIPPAPAVPVEVQNYLLQCVQAGLTGFEYGRGHGLASAAADDVSKKLLSGLSEKIEAMNKVLRVKKRDERLSDSDIAKLQDATTALEGMIGNGADSTAAAAARPAQ